MIFLYLTFLLDHNNIKELTIDWAVEKDVATTRQIQYSTVAPAGILTSYTTTHEEGERGLHTIRNSHKTLQVYTAQILEDMLNRSGFQVKEMLDMDGAPFSETRSQRMLMVAQRAI